MRAAPADFALPVPVPYMWAYWADIAVTNGTWFAMPCTGVNAKQKGMILSGGGIKVPIPGIYHISAACRADATSGGPAYSELQINLNGGSIGATLQNNGSVGSVYYPYAYHQLWLPQALNAGDVITAQGVFVGTNGTFYGPASWAGSGLRVLYSSPSGNV